MTHLRIEQNTSSNEHVTSDIIHKLYETAKGILDEETLNEIEESQVSLEGSLVVDKAYGDEIDWLTNTFKNKLYITASARYIRFADDAVYARLLLYLGDGTGITSSEITNANIFSSSSDPKTNRKYFTNNTDIVSFNELGQLPQVTNIPDQCFEGCTNLTSIDLQNISNIGFLSFRNANLTGVINLPSLITIIARNAFTNCTNITEVNFNLSVFTGFRGNSGTFEGCTSLLKVTGLGNITEISPYTFSGANSLVSVDCTNTSTIGNNAFWNCTSLTSVDLSSCTSIGKDAFRGCTALTSVDLSTVTTFVEGCFRTCTGLTTVTLNPALTTISSKCFLDCTALTTIDLSNVTSIGESAFLGCTGLTSIDLSNVINFGYYAFEGCTSLTSVDLSSCTALPGYPGGVFKGCTSLTTVTGLENITDPGPSTFYGCTNLGLNLDLVLNIAGNNYQANTFRKTAYKTVTVHAPNMTGFYPKGGDQYFMFFQMPNLEKLDLSDTAITEIEDLGQYTSVRLVTIVPSTVTSFNYEAFTSVHGAYIILATNPPTLAVDTYYSFYTDAYIYVPDSSLSAYQTAWAGNKCANKLKPISELPSGITWATQSQS